MPRTRGEGSWVGRVLWDPFLSLNRRSYSDAMGVKSPPRSRPSPSRQVAAQVVANANLPIRDSDLAAGRRHDVALARRAVGTHVE